MILPPGARFLAIGLVLFHPELRRTALFSHRLLFHHRVPSPAATLCGECDKWWWYAESRRKEAPRNDVDISTAKRNSSNGKSGKRRIRGINHIQYVRTEIIVWYESGCTRSLHYDSWFPNVSAREKVAPALLRLNDPRIT